MSPQSDYEILSLPEDASRELVERKYGALLRAYKQKTDEYGVTDEDLAYYEKITGAYDRLTGTVHDFSDPNPTSVIPYRVRKFFYKLSANLDHYKFILVGLLMIAIIAIIVWVQIKEVRKDDLHIKFVGAFAAADQSLFIQEVNKKSDVIQSPDISFFTVTSQTAPGDSQAENAALQFRMQFMSGAIEVIFIDQDNFDVYLNELVFMDLTDFLKEHEGDAGFENLALQRHENTGEEDRVPTGIYGIEFTELGSRYFEDTSLTWMNDYIKGQERSMILGICRTAKEPEAAQNYVVELLESTVSH